MSFFRNIKKQNLYIPVLCCTYYGFDKLRNISEHYSSNFACFKHGTESGKQIISEKRKSFISDLFVHCDDDDDEANIKYTLKSTHIFFRHGARTPLSHLPGVAEVTYDKNKWDKIPEYTNVPIEVRTTDGQPRPPSKLEERYQQVHFKGGMHAGMLTTLGREQAYTLGRRIRKRYIDELHFVNNMYNKNEVSIRSTNVNRCIYSLQSLLGGVYGVKSFKETVVIPVAQHSAEILFPNVRFCDTLRKLEHKTPSYLWEQDGYRFIAHYIKYFIKESKEADKYMGLMNWRDHDAARMAHGLEVPLWLEAIREHVHMWATKSIETFTCGVPQDRLLVLQLVAGPMLNLVTTSFDNVVQKKQGAKKLYLYSCHDSSLVPLLCGLGIFDHKWPPYAADVTLELYSNEKDEYFVKMAYCNEDITLPGYDSPMLPYDKFKEMIAPYVVAPPQYNQMCHDMELARQHAKYWEAAIKSHEQEDVSVDEEAEEFPPNM